MTTKPELKPCRYCGAKLQIVTTEKDEHGCAIERELSCTKCSVIIGYAYSDGEMESCIKLANITPLKPCPDAVEAFAKHVFGGDTELIMKKARECVADLTAAGFTITRAATSMTDAELEREIDALLANNFSDEWRMSNGHFKAQAMEIAKKYRG